MTLSVKTPTFKFKFHTNFSSFFEWKLYANSLLLYDEAFLEILIRSHTRSRFFNDLEALSYVLRKNHAK